MAPRTFGKVPLSIEEQVALLRNRGLLIANEEDATHMLQVISYYRLSAYFLPYQQVKDCFNAGTTFKQVTDTYTFDKELRLLVFDFVEQIEIAVRTRMVYTLATHYQDAHWQDNRTLFVAPYTNSGNHRIDPFEDLQRTIEKSKTNRKPEVFVKHYLTYYGLPANPPSWMCLELLTMGELSNLYKGLKETADKKRIARFFDVHPTVFTSWLHTLTYVRNICAHHARLWNRDFAIEPYRLQKPLGKWITPPFENNKRTFYFLCLLQYLMLRVQPHSNLKVRLETLFQKYPAVPVRYLGIPSGENGVLLDWKSEALWS